MQLNFTNFSLVACAFPVIKKPDPRSQRFTLSPPTLLVTIIISKHFIVISSISLSIWVVFRFLVVSYVTNAHIFVYAQIPPQATELFVKRSIYLRKLDY